APTGEPAARARTQHATTPADDTAAQTPSRGATPTPADASEAGAQAGPTYATASAPPDGTGRTGPVPPPDGATGTTGPAAPPAGTRPPGTGDPTEDPPDDQPSEEPAPDEQPPDQDDVDQALTVLRDRLAEVPEERRWWLPAGDPDLARLVADGLTPPPETVRALLTRTPADDVPSSVTRLLGGGREDVLWPALAGPTTPDLFRVLGLYDSAPSAAPPEVVVVPRDSFTASSAVGPRRGAVRVDETGLTAVGVDSWTSALVAAGAPTA